MSKKLCINCEHYDKSRTYVRHEQKPSIFRRIMRMENREYYVNIPHACLRRLDVKFNVVVGQHLGPPTPDNVRRCEDERADDWKCGPKGRHWKPRKE